MKETNITFSRFLDSFPDSYKDNFTYEGKRALFDHLEEMEESLGEEIELDPIAFCCDYSEYDSAWDAMKEYQPDDMPTVDNSEGMDLLEIEEEQQKEARAWLENETTVIAVGDTGRVIIQSF